MQRNHARRKSSDEVLTQHGKDLLANALAPAPKSSLPAGGSGSVRKSTGNLLNVSAPANRNKLYEEVHWEGYVRKKGDWLPRWEERYLVLEGSSLTYYNTKEDSRGKRNLRGRMILTVVRPENFGKAHGFLIETQGHKHFHLCCATELEKDMWCEMMQAAISRQEQANNQHGATEGNERSRSRNSSMSNSVLNLFPQSFRKKNHSVVSTEQQASTRSQQRSSEDTIAPSISSTPTQVDLREFYYAFRQLLISHSSSPQFFPKLSRDIVLCSNYAPTVPFWGEYHGIDGVLHFFSILYETVNITDFTVTDIAQAEEGSTAVIAGRETMKNRHNNRKFTQQWQHTVEFSLDGRVKSLTITADPIAASAVFGSKATSNLSLPMTSVIGNSNFDNPPGVVHVSVLRGEQIVTSSFSPTTVDDQRKIAMFLGLRLVIGSHTNVYAPSSSSLCTAKTSPSRSQSYGNTNIHNVQETDGFYEEDQESNRKNPVWNSRLTLPFSGASRGKPCFMLVEAWATTATESADITESTETENDKGYLLLDNILEINKKEIEEELIGVAKVNLAPFLALASTSRTVRESVIHTDIARGAVPQWYTLLSASETKASCGRVQLSISFETSNNSQNHAIDENLATSTRNLDSCAVQQDAKINSLEMGPSPDDEVLLSADEKKNQEPLKPLRRHLSRNFSYHDTKRDNHSFRVGNTKFDVPKRYQMIKAVGQGAYGCVIAASDIVTGQALAIKNVPKAFNDLIDAKRILREIRLMRHLQHPNLVNLVDLIRPISLREFEDVYIVTDLMETDLHRVIHSNQSLSDEHIQYFLYQMLVALKYVHSADVLHRDLKPSNILVNSNCDLKLCDFGLARGVKGMDSGLTEYVVTRWYRAPELLLSSRYDKQMDTWAIGCILAEMLGRRPLFPGHDYLHQLKIIMEVVGSPDEKSLEFITNPKAKRFILRQPKRNKVSLSSVYPRATSSCLDILDKMLQFDPRDRITIDKALEHPYLKFVRDTSMESTCPTSFNFDFEECELTKKKLQELIFEDVASFHPEALDLPEECENRPSKSTILYEPSSKTHTKVGIENIV